MPTRKARRPWTNPPGRAEVAKCLAFGEEHAEHIKGANSLQPTTAATTVRVRNGKRLTTDGPFAETKEQLAGYYLVEAANLDEAIALAEKNPDRFTRLDRGAAHPETKVRGMSCVT